MRVRARVRVRVRARVRVRVRVRVRARLTARVRASSPGGRVALLLRFGKWTPWYVLGLGLSLIHI